MPGKKGTKKKTMRIETVDDTRKVSFSVTFEMDGKEQTKTFSSRADLFSWVRGAEMFSVVPKSIVRTVSQTVTVGKPGA